MINSPTKAETKVMVAIKEVNENELPENGTTPSVCLSIQGEDLVLFNKFTVYFCSYC